MSTSISLASVAFGISALTGSVSDKDPLIQNVHSKVLETIENSKDVPGLASEEFNNLKTGIAERWHELVKEGALEVTGTDKEVRPYFVTLQAIIEHVLACELGKSVKCLTGVIHTPAPATPLCTNESISEGLVSPPIENDPNRLFTVKARATIIRDYLRHGGTLYIVYPQKGKTGRNESQLRIYGEELKTYPLHLWDRPLNCDSIDNEWIGAFYLFQDVNGKIFAFAIKIPQANSNQESGNFGLWFGEANKASIYNRISSVLDIIQKHSAEPIPLPI